MVLCGYLFVINTWRWIDFPQLVFFTFSGVKGHIETALLIKIVTFFAIIPLILTIFILKIFNIFNTPKWVINIFSIMVLAVIYASLSVTQNISDIINPQETDFYEKRYVKIGSPSLIHPKRNIILVFAESLNDSLSTLNTPQGTYKINDNDATKFSNFVEGFAQSWTQGAIFSAFTGTHIHYLASYFQYMMHDKTIKLIHKDEKIPGIASASSIFGRYFNFETPNIRYLGDILAENGYKNIFMKNADTIFSGTDKFLSKHSFNPENIYDLKTFKELNKYELDKNWWGARDRDMFDLFKTKITENKIDEPFFAVALTLDMHFGHNPYF